MILTREHAISRFQDRWRIWLFLLLIALTVGYFGFTGTAQVVGIVRSHALGSELKSAATAAAPPGATITSPAFYDDQEKRAIVLASSTLPPSVFLPAPPTPGGPQHWSAVPEDNKPNTRSFAAAAHDRYLTYTVDACKPGQPQCPAGGSIIQITVEAV